MSPQKTLTIMMPVYNGDKFIGGLLESFAAYVENDPLGKEFLSTCEILVVNNRSEDATLKIAHSYERRIPNLRVVTQDTHWPTAEENVFRAFKLARGEFTWVLGCDDIVRFDALPDVIQAAQNGTHDFVVFNVMQSDANGRIESACNYYMRERFYEGDLVTLTRRMGFWWLIAGFSGQIIRTSRVAQYDHAALVARTSPIYSHVTAYLECFADRPAAIVNVQNVIYRLSDMNFDHWRRVAGRLGVFDEYFWTLGYVRQIKYLEHRGIVGRDYLIKMIESDRNSFFRPTAMIYDKIMGQLENMTANCDHRNQIPRSEFNELIEFFEQRDLLARPFLISVRKVYNSILAKEPIDMSMLYEARGQLRSYQSSYLLTPNFVGINGDYEIYRLAGAHYAVHRLFRGALLERIRYLDHVEQAPIILQGLTHDDIIKRISELGIGTDLEDVPTSLMRYCSSPVSHGSQAWHPHNPVGNLATDVPLADRTSATHIANTLRSAQGELRAKYKARNSYLLRFAAWCTVLCLKMSRRLLGMSTKSLAQKQP
jgi:glycosyltransferase involved in cell wall biosynthesis